MTCTQTTTPATSVKTRHSWMGLLGNSLFPGAWMLRHSGLTNRSGRRVGRPPAARLGNLFLPRSCRHHQGHFFRRLHEQLGSRARHLPLCATVSRDDSQSDSAVDHLGLPSVLLRVLFSSRRNCHRQRSAPLCRPVELCYSHSRNQVNETHHTECCDTCVSVSRAIRHLPSHSSAKSHERRGPDEPMSIK
jgi:hypothetical protein